MRKLLCFISLLMLVLFSTNTKAIAVNSGQYDSNIELRVQQCSSSKATLPDILQIVNHLPAAHRSSNFIVSHTAPALFHKIAGQQFIVHTGTSVPYATSSIPLHLAIRVLLI